MKPRFSAQMSLVTGCLMMAASSGAQQIRGQVVQAAAGQAISGAVVSALDVSDRALISVTTDTAGRFTLRWVPGAVTLRVVRLGYRPNRTPLPQGEPRDESIHVRLEQIPSMLATARVSSSMSCPGAMDRRATLELWEQARAGLLAAVVARQQQAHMAMVNYDRQLDPTSKRVRAITTRHLAGASSRPYVAARSLDEFERGGFVEDNGNERTWFSPDADVLLDDRFAASHCFGTSAADARHRGQFGLSFTPVLAGRLSRRVDIEGVLWVDPVARTLTHLEFFFTGPFTTVGRVRASGDLTFAAVANGALMISNWVIVIPFASRATRPGAEPEISFFHETGGFVAEAEWPDGASWRSALKPVGGRIVEEDIGRPLPGAIVTLSGWSDSVLTNASGVFELPLLPPGEYRLLATDTGYSRYVAPRHAERLVVAGLTRTDITVEVGGATAAVRKLCKDLALENSVTILGRLTRDRNVKGQLTIDADWESKIQIGSDGRVAFNGNRQTHVVDDEDRFAVCGVEPGRAVQLDLYILGRPVADTVVIVDKEIAIHEVEWPVTSLALNNAARGAATALIGTVVEDQGGKPVADAEVWIVLTGDQIRADASGRFEARGLKAGRHVIQVRRMGYTVMRDTVTLRFGEEATRQFRMTGQAQFLDTVTTVSSGVKYTSPLLRQFEDRRATGAGRYVSEAELRKEDGSISGWLHIFQKIPGTKITTGTSGEHLESLRGGGSILRATRVKADPSDRRSPSGCWVSVYLDGVPIYQSSSQKAPDLRLFQTQQFAGVEYYAGNAALPAQFSGIRASACGVLLLWTRER